MTTINTRDDVHSAQSVSQPSPCLPQSFVQHQTVGDRYADNATQKVAAHQFLTVDIEGEPVWIEDDNPYDLEPRRIDRFLPHTTKEATAHHHVIKNKFNWDTHEPSLNESLISGCASYCAFVRYIKGEDLHLLPKTCSELETTLRRYAYDGIHNTISGSRAELLDGGYSRICMAAKQSIRNVLKTGDNLETLLHLHRPSENAEKGEPTIRCACQNDAPTHRAQRC